MPVLFDYECDACGARFEHLKMSASEPDPECPGCEALTRKLPPAVNIGTNKGRAVDIAQAEVEKMGFTNMKDNLREGDVAAPSLTKEQRALTDGFWGAGAGMPAALKGQNLLQLARGSAIAANAEGSNPVRKVQEAIRKTGGDGRPRFVDAKR